MCQVQRVTNSCGHINDHVLMPCYLAKDVTPSPPNSPPSSTFTITQEPWTSVSASASAATNPSRNKRQSQGSNESNSVRSGKSKIPAALTHGLNSDKYKKAEEEDMIQRFGFGARNQPYCKLTAPKVLDSPKGFKCMVHACGRAD
ncbi:hypothetical protein BDW75DRAFT_238852 [Aspergillus navahoensis]